MSKAIVVVTGGRDNIDIEKIESHLEAFSKEHQIEYFIHGGARGVDYICGEWAKKVGIKPYVMKPDYKANPHRGAPMIRNERMAAAAVALSIYNKIPVYCLVFEGGNGTAHMRRMAEKYNLKIIECN